MSNEPTKPFGDSEFSSTGQDTQSGLQEIKDRVTDMASKAKDKAGQVADSVSEKLGHQRENAADALGRVASTMHDKAGSVPGGSKAASLTHSIADGMDCTAGYLRDHDFAQMGKDVTNICRKYPIQSFVAALAVGILVGRSIRRK